MDLSSKEQQGNLDVIEKINAVFLGTRDFRRLAEQSVKLILEELKDGGVLGVAIYRVHEKENVIQAYAYAASGYEKVERLLPKKFSQLNISLNDTRSLLVKTILLQEPQESDRLYNFAQAVLPEIVADGIQKAIGFSYAVTYPLRIKHGKVVGALGFATKHKTLTDEQRILLETFRQQLELAFENVLEFERVVERYKRTVATNDEGKPSVHFMLRITQKQNALLEQRAKEAKLNKTSYIRSWLDSGAGK